MTEDFPGIIVLGSFNRQIRTSTAMSASNVTTLAVAIEPNAAGAKTPASSWRPTLRFSMGPPNTSMLP